MNTYIAMMYGQGGQAVDIGLTGGGMDRLAKRISALGKDYQCEQFNWDQANIIAEKIKKLSSDTKIVIGGTSLGANETPRACSYLKGQAIDLIFGIQPSIYGAKNLVPSNVKQATFWYQPWGLAAGIGLGYGSYQWELMLGNKTTKLTSAYTFVSHPGSNSESIQSAIIEAILKL